MRKPILVVLAMAWSINLVAVASTNAESTLALTLDDLVRAHRSAVESIHSVDATLVIYPYVDRNKRATQPQAIWRWTKEGDRERIRTWTAPSYAPPREDGRPRNLGDVYFDGRTVSYLRNWDPENPQTITPQDQGTVYAAIGPQDRKIPEGRNPTLVLLVKFQIDVMDDSRTLWELVNESPRAELVGSRHIEGDELWQIRVEHPTRVGTAWDIFLDPKRNFLVRRTAVEAPGAEAKAIKHVTSFRCLDGGMFFPVQVEVPGKFGTVLRVTVDDLRVNNELPSDAFDYRFPENAIVQVLPADQRGKVVAKLWGPDNRPVKTIENVAELYPQGPHEKRPWLLRWIGTAVISSFIFLGSLLAIRARLRRQR